MWILAGSVWLSLLCEDRCQEHCRRPTTDCSTPEKQVYSLLSCDGHLCTSGSHFQFKTSVLGQMLATYLAGKILFLPDIFLWHSGESNAPTSGTKLHFQKRLLDDMNFRIRRETVLPTLPTLSVLSSLARWSTLPQDVALTATSLHFQKRSYIFLFLNTMSASTVRCLSSSGRF